jgi:hypothetical protein
MKPSLPFASPRSTAFATTGGDDEPAALCDIFTGCQFGDHNSQANYFNAVEQMSAVPDHARQKLKEAREAIEKGSFSEADNRDLVKNLLELTEELSKLVQEAGLVKRFWNRIKEAAPAVASILGAAVCIRKLLGG